MSIPKRQREEMKKDPFYSKCCLTGTPSTQEKIDYHHNLIFAGKQVQEKFAILPVKESIHQYHRKISGENKEKLDWIMWNRATDEQIAFYSKAENYKFRRDSLNKKYGKKSN